MYIGGCIGFIKGCGGWNWGTVTLGDGWVRVMTEAREAEALAWLGVVLGAPGAARVGVQSTFAPFPIWNARLLFFATGGGNELPSLSIFDLFSELINLSFLSLSISLSLFIYLKRTFPLPRVLFFFYSSFLLFCFFLFSLKKFVFSFLDFLVS